MKRGDIVLITGGASGIGRALGDEIARRGGRVVLADRQAALAETAASEARRAGGDVTAVPLDVRDMAAFATVARDVVSTFGRIDYFFNNAGVAVQRALAAYEDADWTDVLDVNLKGVANGLRAVYPIMVRQRSGHIINTASLAGLVPTANMASYAASKFAVVGITKALRLEGKAHGVRASVLCPGFIRTPILGGGAFGRVAIPGATDARWMALVDRLRPMNVEDLPRPVLAAIERNEAVIVVPGWWKAFWYLDRLTPDGSLALWSMFHARVSKELDAWTKS